VKLANNDKLKVATAVPPSGNDIRRIMPPNDEIIIYDYHIINDTGHVIEIVIPNPNPKKVVRIVR